MMMISILLSFGQKATSSAAIAFFFFFMLIFGGLSRELTIFIPVLADAFAATINVVPWVYVSFQTYSNALMEILIRG